MDHVGARLEEDVVCDGEEDAVCGLVHEHAAVLARLVLRDERGVRGRDHVPAVPDGFVQGRPYGGPGELQQLVLADVFVEPFGDGGEPALRLEEFGEEDVLHVLWLCLFQSSVKKSSMAGVLYRPESIILPILASFFLIFLSLLKTVPVVSPKK